MSKINYNILLGCLIVSIGIIIHGFVTKPNTKDSLNSIDQNTNIKESKAVLNLTEAAEYLNMNESQLKAIIAIEYKWLKQTHSFPWAMLPYFQVDDRYYFYRGGLDLWLQDVTTNRGKYYTNNYKMLH